MFANGKEIMRIERDKIWVDPDVEVTEAAEKVLGAMRHMMDGWYKQVWNEAIEKGVSVCDGYHGAQAALRVLKK